MTRWFVSWAKQRPFDSLSALTGRKKFVGFLMRRGRELRLIQGGSRRRASAPPTAAVWFGIDAQDFILPYRRFVIGSALKKPSALPRTDTDQNATPRCSAARQTCKQNGAHSSWAQHSQPIH